MLYIFIRDSMGYIFGWDSKRYSISVGTVCNIFSLGTLKSRILRAKKENDVLFNRYSLRLGSSKNTLDTFQGRTRIRLVRNRIRNSRLGLLYLCTSPSSLNPAFSVSGSSRPLSPSPRPKKIPRGLYREVRKSVPSPQNFKKYEFKSKKTKREKRGENFPNFGHF